MLKKSGFGICISARVVLYLLPLLLLCVQWCSCGGVKLQDHDGTLEKEDKKISKFLQVKQYMKLFVLVKILWNAAISQVSLLIAVNDVVARIYISDVASAF